MSKRKTRRKTLANQLRQAIADSGKSQYRIAKDTGIAQPVISRFVNSDRNISLETADKLMQYFGLELKQ